ncbi:phage minor head protein [Lysobacter sp. HA35]
MSVNAALLDETVDHAVDLHRYSTHVVQRMVAVLNRTDAALVVQLSEALLRLDRESFTVERLDALLDSVRALNLQAYDALEAALQDELRSYAGYEADYQRIALRRAIPSAIQLRFPVAGVSAEQVYAAALSRPFQGRLLRDWTKGLEAGRLDAVRNAVRAGYVEGQTTSQIVQRIRGTKALRFADGVLERSRRDVATVVQTALGHTAQTARQAMVDANADLVKAVKWTATLDSRTSPMCRVRDGLQYTPDDHKPIGHKIPWLGGPGRLHFNCRSVSVPVLKSWRELGFEVDDLPAGTRASMDGQVPAELSYGQWLARQSAARQDEILGPERGKLLRAGKVSVDRFHDDRGRWLSLAQLRERIGP